MTGLKLDGGVRALLETQLDSFEKLEIVWTLRASGQAMSRQALEAACPFTSEAVHEVLADLERAAVIEHDTGGRLVRLGPVSKDPDFDALMQLYEADRLGVLSVLSSLAVERIRNMAARAFADGFVIRKQPDDDDG